MTTVDSIRILQLSKDEREAMLANHPVVKRNYTILTPAISATYNLFRDRVWRRRTGTVLVARPRVGKTWCAKAIRSSLHEEFPSIYQTFLIAEDSSNSRRSGIVTDLMDAEQLPIPSRPNQQVIFSHLITHIETCVAARAGDQFLLVVDEMQLFVESDLKQLLVIHNRLQERGITMTTLGFAQPEISNLHAALKASHAYNLIGRFLAEPIRFEGCSSCDELKVILIAYDGKKYYPIGSDWSYTRFFYPEAYRAGFRLEEYSETLWDMMLEAAHQMHTQSIPMEYLTRVVEYLLLAFRGEDAPDFRLDKNKLNQAIKESNLELFASIMAAS
jgi:hypothetical protein